MPTRPQPVPWPEVMDMQGDLFEWLVLRGHVQTKAGKPTDSPWTAALNVLVVDPNEESRAHRVAVALVKLELFRGADRRADARVDGPKHARVDAEPGDWHLHDERPDVEADRLLRGLQPRLRHIQRTVRKSRENALQLLDQSDHFPEVMEKSKAGFGSLYDAWNERLEKVIASVAELQKEFVELCPFLPPWPQTLSGWQALKREVKTSLQGVDIKWSC